MVTVEGIIVEHFEDSLEGFFQEVLAGRGYDTDGPLESKSSSE